MSNSPPQLTTTQLFQPASSGVLGSGVVPTTPAQGTWLSWEYYVANKIGMPTTSWQPGDVERTILAINAVMLSEDDADIAQMAQGGFLDTAASGSVTYQTLQGVQVTVPVTPDPSIASQNPTGAPGWLDLLGQNVYGVTRLPATYATGPLAIANVSGTTAGPYLAGAYHISNPSTGASYSNQASLSVPSSAIAGSGGVVSGVSPGLSTVVSTLAAHGLAVGSSVYLVIPQSSGITGLNGVFALVSAVTTNTFQVAVGSSGSWTAGGTVYLCTVATFVADVVGIGSNASAGGVTNTVTQANGVSCWNLVGWSGSNWESNTAYAARCRLALAAASPNGPSAAYVYFAESAELILSEQTPAYDLTNGPVVANAYANPQTGIETVVVASSTPASTTLGAAVTPGCAQNPITGVTGANPCVITCANPTSLTSGQSMTVIVSGVLGVPGANGTWTGTYDGSAYAFSIPTNTTGQTYTSGGSVEGGDLGMIDNLLQDNVVPDAIVGEQTVSALALPITVLATVVVPQAYVATYKIASLQALGTYLQSLPLGGVFLPSETVPVSYDGIIGALEGAGVLALGAATYVRQISSLAVNGGTIDVPFPSDLYQALLTGATTVTVVGV
jgi:hypothetical protein